MRLDLLIKMIYAQALATKVKYGRHQEQHICIEPKTPIFVQKNDSSQVTVHRADPRLRKAALVVVCDVLSVCVSTQ